jgi:hypothetical protein
MHCHHHLLKQLFLLHMLQQLHLLKQLFLLHMHCHHHLLKQLFLLHMLQQLHLLQTAISSSYALSSSFAQTAISSSYASTASFAQTAISSSYALSSSFAQTAATASVLNGFDPNAATFTIELIDALTVDFYAPDDLRINTTSSISGSVTASLSVNNSAYTLTNLIDQGDKITVTAVSASVFNLNARYE